VTAVTLQRTTPAVAASAPLFATCRHRPSASFVMALGGGCVAPRNYHSAAIKWPEMIRVVLTDEAYDAIASTLPKGAARWPMQRDRGQCFIQVEAAMVDRMRAMRRPGECYSEVILRLVELEAGRRGA
jgi:hypothetical protein